MSRNKSNPSDFIGKRFGSLTVRSVAPTNVTGAGVTPLLCTCDCGKEKVVKLANLMSGSTMTCGCRIGTKIFRHGRASRDHKARPSAYSSWVSARERCFSPGSTHFPHYGGRGITMCDRWRSSFENFLADLGERPEGYTLERIDVNGNYEPSNCKWIPRGEQMDNLRTSLRVLIDGKPYSAKQLAEIVGRQAGTIRAWFYRGTCVRNVEALRPDLAGKVRAGTIDSLRLVS
jgi:hypothetical protein